MQGYENPSLTRPLVAQSPMSGNLRTKNSDPLGPMPRPRIGCEHIQIGNSSTASLQLCGISFRPLPRTGKIYSGEVGGFKAKYKDPVGQSDLFSKTVHVP